MHDKKISIIMPVYNTPKERLYNSVESVLKQEYEKFELIIVDDGSEPEIALLCDQIAATDDRIVVYHQENQGPSAARNKGITVVNGDFLTFIDSDDVLKPNAFKKVIEAFSEADDMLIFGWSDETKELLDYVQVTKNKKGELITAKEACFFIAGDNYYAGGGYPWNKVWRVSSIKKGNDGIIPMFNEALYIYEDKEWILRVLMKMNQVRMIPEILYEYKYYESSISNDARKNMNRQLHSYNVYNIIIDMLKPYDKKVYQRAVNFYYKFCFEEVMKSNQISEYKAAFKSLCCKISPFDLNTMKKRIFWLYARIMW